MSKSKRSQSDQIEFASVFNEHDILCQQDLISLSFRGLSGNGHELLGLGQVNIDKI